MPRLLRILLTLLAAGVGAYAGLIIVGGGAAGVAWLYLFGDDPWPAWSEPLILAFAGAGLLLGGLWAARAAWRATGKSGA